MKLIFFIKYIESLFTEGMNWEKLKNKEIESTTFCLVVNLIYWMKTNKRNVSIILIYKPIWKKDHIIKSKEDRKLTVKNGKAKEILNP